jgi:hypothetical protein
MHVRHIKWPRIYKRHSLKGQMSLFGGGRSGNSNCTSVTPTARSSNQPPTQIRGQLNAQANKAASTSIPKWFKCGEPEHRMVDCHKGDRYGKSLLIDSGKAVNNPTSELE